MPLSETLFAHAQMPRTISLLFCLIFFAQLFFVLIHSLFSSPPTRLTSNVPVMNASERLTWPHKSVTDVKSRCIPTVTSQDCGTVCQYPDRFQQLEFARNKLDIVPGPPNATSAPNDHCLYDFLYSFFGL